ncbi:hypothetical protein ACNI3K_08360 [Demequina sp. SO4-13]|uniref:hypothetical protein n=1 Tax=Demequina sp. SO4-13 TaxID=3401027 RepID=UPI003AF6AA4D
MAFLMVTTALAVVYGIVSGRYERALAIGAITPAGAAVVAGGEALPTFYAVALGGAALLALQWLARSGAPGAPRLAEIPGVTLLLVLLAWSALVVLLAPLAFAGMETVTEGRWALIPGVVNSSNIAQLLYLGLGIVIIVILARSRTTAPSLLAIPLGVGIALALWRYLAIHAGVPFPEGVFANSPSFLYIEQAPGGVPRFRGIHSEPAGLAGSAIAAAAYGVSLASQTRGARRVAAVALAAAAIFLGLVSTSTTFLVAGAVLVVLAVAVMAWRLVRLDLRVSRANAVGALGVIAGAVLALPVLVGLFTAEVDEKLESTSFDDRSTSDARSFDIFMRTWGLGIGLGSVRASSLVFTLLGAVGVIGMILFVAALLAITLPALRLHSHAPVVWALVAAVIGKVIASPDLSDSSGILWLGLGILAHGVAQSRPRGPASTARRAGRVRALGSPSRVRLPHAQAGPARARR